MARLRLHQETEQTDQGSLCLCRGKLQRSVSVHPGLQHQDGSTRHRKKTCMKYPQEAYDYLETEHIRLLIKEHDGNERVPSLEDRVMEAFMAGKRSASRSYSNLDCISTNHGKINFPRTNL